MPEQSLDLKQRSATTTAVPGVRRTLEVAKLVDTSLCIGCKACQAACMEWNDIRDRIGECRGRYDNPPDLSPGSWTVMRYSEVEIEKGRLAWLIRKDGCMHCSDPGCLQACPAPGAIVQHKNGVVAFNEQACTGCGYCITGCPFNIPRLSSQDGKAYKCTLCQDRILAGLEPACVKTCPTGAILFGSKKDMLQHAAERVAALRERGYPEAGLYDPEGVGGTHVMYVLQYADRPEEYAGLARDPRISPLVSLWKGVAKPLMGAGLGLAVLAGVYHYLTVGPNEPDQNEEEPESRAKP